MLEWVGSGSHVMGVNGVIKAKKICVFKIKEPPVSVLIVDFPTNGEVTVDFVLKSQKAFHLNTLDH